MTNKIKAHLASGILLLVSLCVSLTIAEYSFRYYKTHIKPDPTGGMVVSCQRLPNSSCTRYAVGENMEFQYQSKIAFNNWSFRFSENYSTDKKPDEYRIAVLGDSYTENLPSDFSWVDVFARAIEHNEALKKAIGTKKITVANFGNSGSGVIFMANQLHRVSELYKPDLAIFAFIDEDFNRISSDETPEPAHTVEELIASHIVPPALISKVPDAPDFELERSGQGVSRAVYYNGSDKNIINDKETLKNVHQAMIDARVNNGKIWLWDASKQLWNQWFEKSPSASTPELDPVEQAYNDRDVYFPYFERAVALSRQDAPNILFVNLPTHYETLNAAARSKDPKPFIYWTDFFKRRPDVPLISLRDYLPKASYEEHTSWFVLPWDGHPSNEGAKIYGNLTAELVTRYLEGDHSVLINTATFEKESARYALYLQHQKEEREAVGFLKASRKALKQKDQDKELALLSAAIEVNDNVGAPGLIYLRRATILLKQGMPELAYDDLTKALTKDNNPLFLEKRVEAAIALKNYKSIMLDLAALQKFGQKDPSFATFIAKVRTEQGITGKM